MVVHEAHDGRHEDRVGFLPASQERDPRDLIGGARGGAQTKMAQQTNPTNKHHDRIIFFFSKNNHEQHQPARRRKYAYSTIITATAHNQICSAERSQ